MIELNNTIFHLINDLGTNSTTTQKFFIAFAVYSVPALAFFLLFEWLIKKNYLPVITGSVIFVVSEIFAKFVLSQTHFNYQPFYVLNNVNKLIEKDINNSFPSDHTILIFSFMLAFAFFNKKLIIKSLFVLIACLVGISRIGVGVHYPLDVIVSILTTIFFLFIYIFVDLKLNINDFILSFYKKALKYLANLLRLKKDKKNAS